MKNAKAIIQWVLPYWRNAWTPDARYAGIVRFQNDKTDWPDTTWTLIARCNSASEDGWIWNADVWFLSDEAPTVYLVHGNKFEYYAGWKKVADGVIVTS